MKLFEDIDMNIGYFNDAFQDCGDLVQRKFPVGQQLNQWVCVMFIDMLVNAETVNLNIMSNFMKSIRKLHFSDQVEQDTSVFDKLKEGAMTIGELREDDCFENINMALMSGDTVVLVDGFAKAFVVSTKGFPNRGVPKVSNEVVVQGSQEAFSEVFRINTALIRRRIRDVNLKVKQMKIGRRSGTDIALMYINDVVRPDILKEAESRLKNIDIDAVLDCGIIEQLIEDDWKSPFPQTQITERPDKAASALLEGRIAVVVDNSPCVLLIPTTLNTFFQSSEDYYQRFQIVTFMRLIRFVSVFLACALPGLYIATATFHPSMIPMLMTFKMAAARQAVPIPALIEVLLMELAFELLREAGIRLPQAVGSAIGIVGGLIVGQAAVEAGIVSPIVVIIVATTGIASFAVPSYQLMSGFRLSKYLVIFCSAILGLFGFWVAILVLLIHMVSLKSFGIPYMFPFASSDMNDGTDMKDTLFRMPIMFMQKRPFFANRNQIIRMSKNKSGNKRKEE